MDQTVLVKEDRDIGVQVMEALSHVKIPITLWKWIYVPQLEEWQMIIATPWYDSKGPRATYTALVNALQQAGIYERVPMRRVSLKSPSDPLVQALQQEASEQREREFDIYILKHAGQGNGARYSLFFFPISGPGGAAPSRNFANLAALRRFLTENLRVRPRSLEDALDEVEHSGFGSVYPVALKARDIRKLGLG